MKRYSQSDLHNNISMADCLMLLSRGVNIYNNTTTNNNDNPDRVFECKTCNRVFQSFQALGGHRASHKKPKLTDGVGISDKEAPVKPKSHECSICGLEFTVGQALGGHMRRHRSQLADQQTQLSHVNDKKQVVPVLKKPNSKRVLNLDLNLTPIENDFELFKLRKIGPVLDYFL